MLVDSVRKFLALLLSITVWAVAPGFALRTPPLPGSGFSRGIAVAEFSQREVPAILSWGDNTWLAWSGEVNKGRAPILRTVDHSGRLSEPKPIPLPDGLLYIGRPQLVLARGSPWLLFLAREATSSPRSLYALALDLNGEPAGLALPLRPESGVGVGSYSAVGTGNAIWAALEDDEGWIWLFSLDVGSGKTSSWRLGPGEAPALAAGEDRIHLVWAQPAGDFYILLYAGIEEAPASPVELRRFPLGIGTIPSPPALALGAGWAYAAVGFEYRGGELAGMAEVWICAFPRGNPQRSASYSLRIPGVAPSKHSLTTAGLCLAPLPPQATIRPTNLYQPRGGPSVGEHALMTLGAKLYRRGDTQVQPVVVAFAAGAPVAWDLIAVSRDFSYFTALSRSEYGWHAAWLDMLGFGDYRLYYASTSEEERKALNRLGWDDVTYFLGTTASGLIGGLAFIPLFLIASVPGLVLIFFHYVLGGEESMRYRWPKLLLALSLLPYLVLKIALAGTFGGVPFAQWLPQPAATTAGRVIPFIPALFGAAAMFIYLHRSTEPTVFPAWAAFVVTDLVFTIVILGPVFAGG